MKRSRTIALSATSTLALATIAGLFATTGANAGNGYNPNYRYCMQASISPDGPDVADCAFNTYEQCRAAASGLGYCLDNPAYTGTATQPKPRNARRH
jgi:hypothetical protein